ncbi:MAG TPA: choice-of-anchor Q domain-containing protein [Saprospiraceae bacterium]|nr:choice-of-anchor Q domain-containing protein [Saprospiraceae bacterium]
MNNRVSQLLKTTMKIFLHLFILGLFTTLHSQIVLYVDHTATGSNNGESWNDAFPTLQAALNVVNDAANAGTSYAVWVAQGTYYPDEGPGVINNDRSASFRIQRDGVELYGGFPNGGGNDTFLARNWQTFPTILSGDIDQNGERDENSYHVIFLGNMVSETFITNATIIDGFIIANGNADADENDMTNDNFPDFIGGGIYCHGQGEGFGCSPLLVNLIFTNNFAYYGGGLANNGTNGGISNPVIINCLFFSNESDGFGGGIVNGGFNGGESSPTIINTTLSQNSALIGGGMLNFQGSMDSEDEVTPGVTNPVIINSIFWGNTAQNGEEIFVYGEGGSATFSIIRGDCPAGLSCDMTVYDVDPLFLNSGIGNFRLLAGSPGINAGSNSGVPSGINRDLAANARIVDSVVDIGAYEFRAGAIPALETWGLLILALMLIIAAMVQMRWTKTLSRSLSK